MEKVEDYDFIQPRWRIFNWNYIWSLYLYTTSMLQMEWFLMDNTLRNFSVRFLDYGPS